MKNVRGHPAAILIMENFPIILKKYKKFAAARSHIQLDSPALRE
jgi:hypothetical protein